MRLSITKPSSHPIFIHTALDFPLGIHVVSAIFFLHHVQISTPAPFALHPSQRDGLEAFPHHRAASQDLKELEELGREMDTGRRLGLLLQHFHCLCRGANLYVCESKAHI